MSLRDKDVANIRRAFNRSLSTKNFTLQEYQQLLDSIERLYLKYFVQYCKESKLHQGEARRNFYQRHLQMDHRLTTEMEIVNLPEEEDVRLF